MAKIKKGDNVLIISGKDKGKRGKTLRVFPNEARVMVENINLRKKHVRPKSAGQKGQIVEVPASIHISNVKLICPKCGIAARIGYKITGEKKYRMCKKCEQEI